MTTRSNNTEFIRRAFGELMKDVATSIPGHFLAFDPATQLAQIQIGVQKVDINGNTFEPSPLIECPVAFIGGSQYTTEHQIDPGDECWVFFSQRCIDGWNETGGVANNPIMRFHNINDAAVLPGFRSQPNVIQDFANNGYRIRNADGTHYLWLKNDKTIEFKNDNVNVTMQPDGTTQINVSGSNTFTMQPDGTNTLTNGTGTLTMQPDGIVDINGAQILTNGAITSPVSVTAPTIVGSASLQVAGVEVKEHTHDKGTYLDAESRPLQSGNSGALS